MEVATKLVMASVLLDLTFQDDMPKATLTYDETENFWQLVTYRQRLVFKWH